MAHAFLALHLHNTFALEVDVGLASGQTITLNVEASDTIGDIKVRLWWVIGWCFLVRGSDESELVGWKTLSDYNIQPGERLLAVRTNPTTP